MKTCFPRSFAARIVLAIAALLTVTLASPRLLAQVDTGSISGTIQDTSGAVIPNASVTLVNTATGLTLKAKSDAMGLYRFSAVRIGTYSITAEAPGFQKVTQENAALSIQQNLVVNLTLRPGNVSQQVTVTAAPPALQTQDASVGGVVEQRTINDLPLNGRNYTFLAQLDAGVTQAQQDSRGLNSSGSFAANGMPSNQNNYLLDGIDNNSNLVDFLNGNSYVYMPSVDALSEFKVQTSNFSAEFGRAGGAVLNATVKSGTDRFHGDVWEFFRNDGLDAKNYFETVKGRYQQNQFGGALGGPIRFLDHGSMRTFFFVDYEGLRINQATPYTSTVPTALERSSGFTNLSELLTQGGTQKDVLGRIFAQGQVLDPATTRQVTYTGANGTAQTGYVRDSFPGNILPANRLDPNAKNLLMAFPAPTSGTLFNNYQSDPLMTQQVNQGDFRLDQTFSTQDLAFARFSRSDGQEHIPGPFNTIINGGGFNTGDQSDVAENAVVGWTHIFSPSLVNEARFGFTSVDTLRTQAFAGDLNAPSQFGIRGIPQAPNNGGLPTYTLSGLTEIGGSPWEPTHEADLTYQATENLTKTVGRHTFKGGFEFQHIILHFYQPAYGRGSFDFNGAYTEVPTYTNGNTGIAQLLLSPIPSTVPGGVAAGGVNYVGGSDAVRGSNQATPSIARNYYAGYGQDDWKVSQKLMLNLGLRYEFFGHGVSPGGQALNYLPATGNSGAQLLMPNQTCKNPGFSPSVQTALAADNISVTCSGNPALVESDRADFAPRVGFAYQTAPDFVIRSGFGLFYGTTVNGDDLVDGINYPFSYTETYPEPDPAHPVVFPDGNVATFENGLSDLSFTPSVVNAKGVGFTGTDYHFRTPYTAEYNLSLEYELAHNQTFTLGYVGTQARHLQVHAAEAGYNAPTEILVPSANPQNFVPYPNLARNFTRNSTQANSQYNAMQATYQVNNFAGLDLLGNYTWSKCRTDSRDILTNDIGSYRAASLPGFGIHGDYGLCDYDVTDLFHFSGTYALPIGNGHAVLGNASTVENQLIGGWQTNFILTLQSGNPFTVPCSVSTSADFGCYANVVSGVSLYGQHNVNQWMNPKAFANPPVASANGQTDFSVLGGPPTQLYGPSWRRLDFSAFKEFPFGREAQNRVEFRAEFFNLLNHPNFGNPGFSAPGIAAAPGALNFNSINFGKILGTRDGAADQREIQLALKLYY